MSTYEEALSKVRAATTVFRGVQDDYRAGRISDDAYLAARRIYDQAEAEFDAAYAEASV